MVAPAATPAPLPQAYCCETRKGKTVLAAGFFLGRATNNYAEYQGLLNALKLLTSGRQRHPHRQR